jgi:hypothetical protein
MHYELLLPVIGICAAGFFVLYRAQVFPFHSASSASRSIKFAPSRFATAPNPYPAVSVRSSSQCDAQRAIKGQRFLGGEAPALPLEGCTASICDCRYVHHVDRRTGNLDRRIFLQAAQDGVISIAAEDQRHGCGRRASDWAAAYQMHTPG